MRVAGWLRFGIFVSIGAFMASSAFAAPILEADIEIQGPESIGETEDDARTEDGSPATLTLRESTATHTVEASATATTTSHQVRSVVSLGGSEFRSGEARARAETKDIFDIMGSGDIKMTYVVSGGGTLDGRRDPSSTSDFRDVVKSDFGLDLIVGVTRGFSGEEYFEFVGRDRDHYSGVTGDIIETIKVQFTNAAGSTDNVFEFIFPVSTGEWNYEMVSQTVLDLEDFRGTGILDFGSTSELVVKRHPDLRDKATPSVTHRCRVT